MGVANVPAASASGLNPYYQKFTSSGTFTLPTGYGVSKPLLIDIQVIGGGGAGSGALLTANTGNVLGVYRWQSFFGGNGQVTVNGAALDSTSTNANGSGGGSGGIAKTQMYLTENLTITVGAAGARTRNTYTYVTNNSTITNNQGNGNVSITSANIVGGSGGSSTAGAVTATGGVGGTITSSINAPINGLGNNASVSNATVISNSTNTGGGGTPAGTAGDATPLLGTIAGGAGATSSIKGSFGVGGIKTDGTTSTGVDGTGGGHDSNGASGAVIITWWA